MTTETPSTKAPQKPIFDLAIETLDPRPFFTIDGQSFELADPDDYSLRIIRQVNRIWKVCLNLEMVEKLTAKQETEYLKDLDWLLERCAPTIPDEIRIKLRRSHKTAIVMSFFVEAARRHPLMPQNPLGMSLLDSNGSMEAIPEDG